MKRGAWGTLAGELPLLSGVAPGQDTRPRVDDPVRELEEQLKAAEAWERKSKPKVKAEAPKEIADGKDLTGRIRIMLDLRRLAIETDSTRRVPVFLNPAMIVQTVAGATHETLALTHHGDRPEALDEPRKVEEVRLRLLADFLSWSKGSKEGPQTLLDRTMVLYGFLHGNRRCAFEAESARAPGGRWLQAQPASGLRSQDELPAGDPFREHAPEARPRDRQVLHDDRGGARMGDGWIASTAI
jgi:hypothetical protein